MGVIESSIPTNPSQSTLLKNQSPVMTISLLDFARDAGIYLDESRKSFFERHLKVIEDLISGKLKGRNRFRELLLGVKSVGKSTSIMAIRNFVNQKYPEVVCIHIKYDGCDKLLSDVIMNVMLKKYPNSEDELVTIKTIDIVHWKIEALEEWLHRHNIKLLILLDEFHTVYRKAVTIGRVIVQELSAFADSSAGINHIIVTGSSSILRKLAFAKIPVEVESTYPSYDKSDLNSTKLQPQWIYPIVDGRQFAEMLTGMGINQDKFTQQFINSAGRPGLAIEVLNEIPYALTVKCLSAASDSIESQILTSLYDCTTSYNLDNYPSDGDDGLLYLANELRQVPESVLQEHCKIKIEDLTERLFIAAIYNLADEGLIIMRTFGETKTKTLCISGIYIYWQIAGKKTKLTWKAAAALKQRWKLLFPEDSLYDTDSTSFNFDEKVTNDYYRIGTPSTTNNDSVFNRLHKELRDGKDNLGADGIYFRKEEGKLIVIRLQLKLSKSVYTVDDITEIKNNMETGSRYIIQYLMDRDWDVIRNYNFLVTTGVCKKWLEALPEKQNCSPNIVEFGVITGSKLSQIWPEEVKLLGKPYGSNKNLKKLQGLNNLDDVQLKHNT
eukprot:gene10339-13890_t